MRKILVFHGGSIGDTLMAFPAIQCIRQNFQDAFIDFFSCPGVNDFSYLNLYENAGLGLNVKRFYIPPGAVARLPVYGRIFLSALAGRYDLVVCLLPWRRNKRIDNAFFRLAGAKEVIYPISIPEDKSSVLPSVPVLMLRGLAEAGLKVPPEDSVKIDLRLTEEEMAKARQWFASAALPEGSIPIAVGTGGKKPVCHWPIENYVKLLSRLVAEENAFPIFFGGSNEESVARRIVAETGRGAFAKDFGLLSLRETVAAIACCRMFIGNDSGTIHLAAAAGVPVLGVYSAHNYKNLWYPLVAKRRILRAEIPCAVCDLPECPKASPAPCIDMISPDEVFSAAKEMLRDAR